MAEIYYARTDVSYSGGDKFFTITFSYIKKEHIKVFINDEETENIAFNTESQIVVNDDLIVGDIVSIRRTTPLEEKMVVFSDTSILNKDVQNLAQDQVFNVVQEVYDTLTTNKKDTDTQIATNKAETDGQIEATKQELLDIQDNFEGEINTKLQEVSSAAEKINQLEEAVSTAVNASEAASAKADEVTEIVTQADINIQNNLEEITGIVTQADIDIQNKVEEITEIVGNVPEEIETISTTKANIDLNNLSEAGLEVLRKNAGTTLPLFTPILSDHILEGHDAVGWALQGSLVTMTYPQAVEKVQELYTNGTDTEYRGITCRHAADGRYVADIAQKDAIDELFMTSGVADFYILDSVNEQFYLPRSRWFNQMTLDTSIVNNFNEAGLPDFTARVGSEAYLSLYGGAQRFSKTAYTFGATSVNQSGGVEIKGSYSNPIYGNSDTVQPPSSNKLLYYRVGDVVINSSEIDIGNVLSDLQLKADMNLSNVEPSQSFKDIVTSYGMPDYSSLITVSTPYTAPSDGVLYLTLMHNGDNWGTIYVNDILIMEVGGNTGAAHNSVTVLLNKNDICRFSTLAESRSYFIPMKGVSND